jgi:hypothetical protein
MKTQNRISNNLSLDQVKEVIDEYTGTIHAIQAFISLSTWDQQTKLLKPMSKYSLGRRMETSSQNQVSPKTEITPDAVIQINNSLGYVIEAKYSLPKDTEFWSDYANQLLKYDDDLLGWWTPDEKFQGHCTTLLIEEGRFVRFKEYLEQWMIEHLITFSQNVSIIHFSKSDNAKPYFFLRKEWGQIQDIALSNRLKFGEKIPIIKVVATYGDKKFYDTEPPAVEFTMATIWQDVITPEGVQKVYDKKLGGHPVFVKLDDLTYDLQRLFGQTGETSRDVAFPKKDWIRKAMDEFENIGLARKLDDNPDGYDYLVIFRQIRKELLDYFVENRNKYLNAPKARQLRLSLAPTNKNDVTNEE